MVEVNFCFKIEGNLVDFAIKQHSETHQSKSVMIEVRIKDKVR